MAPLLITSPRWRWRRVLSGSHFLVLRSIMLAFPSILVFWVPLSNCLHDIFPCLQSPELPVPKGSELIAACSVFEGGMLECTGTDRQKSATGEFWAGHTSAGQILRTPQKGIIWDVFA